MQWRRNAVGTIVDIAASRMPTAALPAEVHDTFEVWRVDLTSRHLLDELPRRLAAPGRARLVPRLVIGAASGRRAGLRDSRAIGPP